MAKALDHRGRPRVAITGMGVKTPAGNDLDAFWKTLTSGRSTAATIERFDPSALSVRFGCEVRDFDVTQYVTAKEARRLDRVTQLGFAAAADALADAGDPNADPARVRGRRRYRYRRPHHARGPGRRLSREGSAAGEPVPRADDDGERDRRHDRDAVRMDGTEPVHRDRVRGERQRDRRGRPPHPRRHRRRRHDRAAPKSCMTPTAISAFARMTALSTRNDDPRHASRPFDADRDGFVMGEGAAALLLERWDRAVARGAHIYGEVVGYGRNADAYHITAPSPGGEGAAACMQLALDDAAHRPGGNRPRQRARHVDTAERRGRGRGDAQGVRRRTAAGDVDQGRDRTPHRRGRSDRGGRVRCWRSQRARSRRRRTSSTSARTSPSTSSPASRVPSTAAPCCRTRSVSVVTTPRWCSLPDPESVGA